MTNKDKLRICRETRQIAAESLSTALIELLNTKGPLSEKAFRDAWLSELRKHQDIFQDGWYIPPPHGIGVLFGTTNKGSRHNYKTLRPESMWPKDDVFLDKENGMAYLYASPVSRTSGIIGDFGLTVYLGSNEKIKDHLRQCMKINQEIFNHIQVGMKFSEVYKFSENIIKRSGLINNVTSKTDPTGKDLGHTIPATYFEWTRNEKSYLKSEETSWKAIVEIISNKRIFINAVEQKTYQPGMAVTLEPRLTNPENPGLPMGSFHSVVVINKDGTKELLTNFDKIFSVIGMDYMQGVNK